MRLIILLLCCQTAVFGQSLPAIEEKTKNLGRTEGFFPYYWDEATGKLWLEVSRVDSEFLYVPSLTAGLGSNDIGLDRGLLGESKLVKFEKAGRKLLLVQPNLDYRAQTSSPQERKAVENSFARSIIWGFNIEAATGNRYLVDISDFIVRDAMQAANRIRNSRQGSYSLDKTRSAVYLPNTKNFPVNTEFEATVTLINTDGQSGNWVRSVTPSSEAITLQMHHSFVQLPDAGFKPRSFDPRAGYFPFSYYDYATPVSEPLQKMFIPRHRLQKKDPGAQVSDAVQPIIYYLDPGTPEPVRSALLEGAAWWNQAFEAAGYRNAFQVKMLPDGADPWDIRYNMINWVHRSTRGWSYGMAITDPRTGEIIKGQVTLGSLRVRQDYLIAEGLLAPYTNGEIPADNKMLQMALARLRQLSAHEVGHTLGLAHNYAASARNRSSVMDYPAPRAEILANGEVDLSQAYATGIGEWDKVSISYGYADFTPGVNEKDTLSKILSAASRRGLMFIADADARPPFSIHPTAHLWDNGNDAVAELQQVMALRRKALNRFGENNIRNGRPMASLEMTLVPIYLYHRYQVEAVAKLVGGLNYTYAVRGDSQLVSQPLPKAQQMAALRSVIEALDPKNLRMPDHIIRLIPPYSQSSSELFRKRTGLAFDALAPAETAADLPLSFLLHVNRMNRLAQTGADTDNLGLDEVIRTLIASTWKAPRLNGMEALIQMQTEQILLTYLLAASVHEQSSFATRSIVKAQLAALKNFITEKRKTATGSYLGHLLLALERMEKPEQAKTSQHIEIPPGAPIGCYDHN